MTISGLADETISGLNSPTDLSNSFVSFWLRTNVGRVNLALNTSFSVVSGTGITPDLNEDEKVIWETMFNSYYWGKKVADNLGAVGTNTALEVSENGFTAKFTNKNEVSKTYMTFKKDADMELQRFIDSYKRNKHEPIQVIGDDNQSWDGASHIETNQT